MTSFIVIQGEEGIKAQLREIVNSALLEPFYSAVAHQLAGQDVTAMQVASIFFQQLLAADDGNNPSVLEIIQFNISDYIDAVIDDLAIAKNAKSLYSRLASSQLR